MAATVHTDTLTDISCTERHGTIVSLQRECLVTGLTAGVSADTWLAEIYTALDSAGLTASSTLSATGMSNLILTERNPSMADQTAARVRLVYQHFANDGADIETLTFGGLAVVSCRSTIRYREVSTYPAHYTDTDLRDKAITVRHVYPDGEDTHEWDGDTWDFTDDTGDTMPAHELLPGREITQAAKVQIPVVGEVLTIAGLLATNSPRAMQYRYAGKLNSATWFSHPQYYWKCLRADWTAWDVSTSPDTYKWVFEFEYTGEDQRALAEFIDKATGRVPEAILDGVGRKRLDYPETVDFNDLIRV